MFFSRKAKPLIDRVAAILASYFSIEADITARWCADKLDSNQAIGDKKADNTKADHETPSNTFTINLPFCYKTCLLYTSDAADE